MSPLDACPTARFRRKSDEGRLGAAGIWWLCWSAGWGTPIWNSQWGSSSKTPHWTCWRYIWKWFIFKTLPTGHVFWIHPMDVKIIDRPMGQCQLKTPSFWHRFVLNDPLVLGRSLVPVTFLISPRAGLCEPCNSWWSSVITRVQLTRTAPIGMESCYPCNVSVSKCCFPVLTVCPHDVWGTFL